MNVGRGTYRRGVSVIFTGNTCRACIHASTASVNREKFHDGFCAPACWRFLKNSTNGNHLMFDGGGIAERPVPSNLTEPGLIDDGFMPGLRRRNAGTQRKI